MRATTGIGLRGMELSVQTQVRGEAGLGRLRHRVYTLHVQVDTPSLLVVASYLPHASHPQGVLVTLIDFTASRLQTPSGDVAFCDLSADPELFQGPKGNCQVRRRAALPCS